MDLSNYATQKRMLALIEKISPLQRLIISPGLDSAFDILKREIPDLKVHEYASGTSSGDWIVPESWAVKNARMTDQAGNVIASFEENTLFVAPFSEPIEGWFSKGDIEGHLSTRPDRPNAFVFEHRHAYNYQLVDWGITLPYNLWQALPDEKYHILIDIERKQGSMKVGEVFIPGRRSETLCICAHIDELCNDDLSGCVAATEIMHYIKSLSNRQYSYQILLVPEIIGSLFFVDHNPQVIANTIGMFFLEAVGAGERWCLKKALAPNTQVERLLHIALDGIEKPFHSIDFFDGYGNDERVYAWPPINIPGVALQRFPFEEYHTSDDTPDVINEQYLLEAVEVGKNLVDLFERDFTPRYIGQLQPWLTRRGLYFDSVYDKGDFHKYNNLLLFNINGKSSILDLVEITGLKYHDICVYLNKFVEAGLIEKLDTVWGD